MKLLNGVLAALAVTALLAPASARASAPDACSTSFWTGVLIDGLNEMPVHRGNVVELGSITTRRYLVLPLGIECHVTLVLRTIDRPTGVVTLTLSPAGDNIFRWLPDGVRAKQRSSVNHDASRK